MHIYLGSDHGGFALKESFKAYLVKQHPDYKVEDCGAYLLDPDDDYPEFALQVAHKVVAMSEDQDSQVLGIVFCRSGSGVVIAANKVLGVRAVEIYNETIAAHAKSHNKANVIAFSGDYLTEAQMTAYFETFMSTPVDSSERHARRLQQITHYEQQRNQ